jgi:hypothetical protein
MLSEGTLLTGLVDRDSSAKRGRAVFVLSALVASLLIIGCSSNQSVRDAGGTPIQGPHGPYATTFLLTEFPISEGGRWSGGHTVGLDWSDLGTISGHSYGSVVSAGYDDPVALLVDTWGPDQMVEGTVFSINQQDSPNQEVELRLRSSVSAHRCTGYEITWRVSANETAYMGIARWNGKLNDFTDLGTHYGAQFGVSNGDVIRATAIGGVISAYKNGALQARVTDSTFPTGSPGMGTDWGPGTNTDFGLSDFAATDRITAEIANQ